MLDVGAIEGIISNINASLDQIRQMVLAGGNPGPGPGPSEGGGGDSGPHGFQPGEVAVISGVLRSSGAYAHVGNPDAFLGNFLGVVQAAPQPTGPADIRAFLDAALVAYSDSDGDGVANLPPFSDDVVNAAWGAFVQAFSNAPTPSA